MTPYFWRDDIEVEKDGTSFLQIADGEFDGFVVRFLSISLVEPENKEDDLQLSFKYEPYNSPENLEIIEGKEKSPELRDTLGDIVVYIIERNLEKNENGRTDNKESDTQ